MNTLKSWAQGVSFNIKKTTNKNVTMTPNAYLPVICRKSACRHGAKMVTSVRTEKHITAELTSAGLDCCGRTEETSVGGRGQHPLFYTPLSDTAVIATCQHQPV